MCSFQSCFRSMSPDGTIFCIRCNNAAIKDDDLELVGGRREDAVKNLESRAHNLQLSDVLDRIKTLKKTKKYIYIHRSCRREIFNPTRRRSSSADQSNNRLVKKQCCRVMRSEFSNSFDFAVKCLYCENECKIDAKNPKKKKNFRTVTNEVDFYQKHMQILVPWLLRCQLSASRRFEQLTKKWFSPFVVFLKKNYK